VRILTDGAFTKARIKTIDGSKIFSALEKGEIAVVAGSCLEDFMVEFRWGRCALGVGRVQGSSDGTTGRHHERDGAGERSDPQRSCISERTCTEPVGPLLGGPAEGDRAHEPSVGPRTV